MKEKKKKLLSSLLEDIKQKLQSEINEIKLLKCTIHSFGDEINDLKSEIIKFKSLMNIYKNESANKNKLIDLLFKSNYEDDAIEIAVIKSFVNDPMIIYRGKVVDTSNANSITIYINNGEFVELDINR